MIPRISAQHPMVVFAEGRFGAAVAERLRRQTGAPIHSLVAPAEPIERIVATAGFVAVALWRRYDRECTELDAHCWRLGIPWSPVFLAERFLFCGPHSVPGHGPCFSCFQRRYLTHLPSAPRDLALLRAYAQDPALGPAGFAPASAAMAAAALLINAREGAAAAGKLCRVDLLSGEVIDTRVVRVHACPRCGRHDEFGQSGARFVRHLVPMIQEHAL